MRNVFSVYRQRFAKGRVYSPIAYFCGALLRRRFTDAGALAWLRGSPMPNIRNDHRGTIVAGDVALYPDVTLICRPGARLSVGDGTYINRNTFLFAEKEISVGEDCMISWDVIITDTDGFGEERNPGGARPVKIGDRVWIGSKAVILGGAVIGDNVVVAGGSVVTGEVATGAIVATRPAHEIGRVE